jgi:hypothetical protein
MITPPPRQAHGQKYDAANLCSCKDTGNCYSNITEGAQYCGLGCLGEACLYYQIGCFQNCGTCSMTGKDLYVTPADLQRAGNCNPPEPTLPEEFRSYNIDSQSTHGDWTKPNPWRAPGTAGLGTPEFQPCGVNSGWRDPDGGSSGGSAGPPAGGQPLGANGTDLPAVGAPAVWKSGATAEVEFSIYANHAGGYHYRLCKMSPGGTPTEDCFQQNPLDFATETTTIKYYDGSRAPFTIPARTVSQGTHPAGSQWRLNPIPMCNCDQGAYCRGAKDAEVGAVAVHRRMQDKCEAELNTLCGQAKKQGTTQCDNCLKAQWSKVEAAGCSKDGFSYCGKGPGPAPAPGPKPPPSPTPPGGKCDTELNTLCGQAKKQGTTQCDNCLKAQWSKVEAAGCSKEGFTYCGKGPGPAPAPGPKPSSGEQYAPYADTHFRPGQTSKSCPTGLMFNSSWDEGVGSGPNAMGYGDMPYSMTDVVKVPTVLGRYMLSWRWDCEQTPQVRRQQCVPPALPAWLLITVAFLRSTCLAAACVCNFRSGTRAPTSSSSKLHAAATPPTYKPTCGVCYV